jgi:hypothetical protein
MGRNDIPTAMCYIPDRTPTSDELLVISVLVDTKLMRHQFMSQPYGYHINPRLALSKNLCITRGFIIYTLHEVYN